MHSKTSVSYSEEEVKLRLKEIRDYSVEHMDELAEEFRQSVAKHNDAHVILVKDAAEAVAYLKQVAQDTKTIAVAKSSTIDELRADLEKGDYTLVDTYSAQFSPGDDGEKKINYPWQLPISFSQSAWDTFDYSSSVGQETEGVKDIVGLLGVNAASAEDGAIFFLQHSANIGNILRQARILVLVIGLEKIAKNRDDAFFQARCAGTFGMESIILDLEVDDTKQKAVNPLAEMADAADSSRELHIILLDNGRTSIAKGDYRELLRCIGCRSCLKQCPGYRYLDEFGYFPREYLWSFLMGFNPSVDLCSYCTVCEAECPVDIPLAKLISRAKAEHSNTKRLIDTRVLMNMTRIAPLASWFAPLVNWLARVKLLRMIMEKFTGIDRRRSAPTFHRETFERWFRSRRE